MDVFQILRRECQGRVIQNEPLSLHTSFGIGGPADWFVWADKNHDIEIARQTASAADCAFMVIGNGTNLLVHDEGIRGIVVRLGPAFAKMKRDGDQVKTGAAVDIPNLLDYCARHGLRGLAFAAGIPGTVGGALYTDANTKTGWIRELLSEVTVIDKNNQIRLLDAESFRHTMNFPNGGEIIIEASFQLTENAEEDIRGEMNRYLIRRRETQPIDEPSAGCIFKNPEDQPAGRLIDQCGCKGMRIGGALVSDKHANFIINTGGARAKDVLELTERIRERVYSQTGISLGLEINVIDSMGRSEKQ